MRRNSPRVLLAFLVILLQCLSQLKSCKFEVPRFSWSSTRSRVLDQVDDEAINFVKIVHVLKERNKYLELKLDEVCKKSRNYGGPKPCAPSNTDNIPPSYRVKAMVK